MIEEIMEHAVTVIEVVGAAILVLGFTDSLILAARVRTRDARAFLSGMTQVRCRLGTYLLLGLEFLIASDVITTILHPTRDELIAVALLVAIRTAIGYFLGKEMSEVREAEAG